MPDVRDRSRLLVIGVVALVAVAGALWFLLGGDEPDAVDASAALDQADAADTPTDGADDAATDDTPTAAADPSATATDAPAGASGTWTVDTEAVAFSFADGTGSFLGFRIDEELSSIGATEAVGRTPVVEGELTLADATVTAAVFGGDARALVTDDSRRDDRARAALGDGRLAFELTAPIELDAPPAPGDTVSADATGDLTVNGVTREVTVPLEASLSDSGTLVVTSSFDVSLADHDVEAPSAPIVLGVSDVATVEVQLFLTRAG